MSRAEWELPWLTDYVDTNSGAVQRLVDKLELSQDREKDLNAIKEIVWERVRALSINTLLTGSGVIADQLYKTGNVLNFWSGLHYRYIAATAGTFFQSFHQKGYVLRYWINNAFESGMHRPLFLFRDLFEAAGLAYICPESVVLGLMKERGIPSDDFVQHYAQFEEEGRHVAHLAIKECSRRKLSYVLLDLADKRDLLDEMSADIESVDAKMSVVRVFRSESPAPNSNIRISIPESAGESSSATGV